MDMEQARVNMIKQQIRTWGVLDDKTLALISETSRDFFVPKPYRQLAFADTAIPLGHDQVMLHPKEEAHLIQALQLTSDDKVLEIGTGSGYTTALLSKVAGEVISVEIMPAFVESASKKLAQAQCHNVTLCNADGAQGWSANAPYDAIAITGSLPFLPNGFREQVRVGGRIFAIIGEAPAMEATLLTRVAEDEWTAEKLFETVVPPLINAQLDNTFEF